MECFEYDMPSWATQAVVLVTTAALALLRNWLRAPRTQAGELERVQAVLRGRR